MKKVVVGLVLALTVAGVFSANNRASEHNGYTRTNFTEVVMVASKRFI